MAILKGETTMQVVLNRTTAKQVAALVKSSGTDKARPVLTGMSIEWNTEGEVSIVTTNSYFLSCRKVDDAPHYPDLEKMTSKGTQQAPITLVGKIVAGSVLVPAKQLAQALVAMEKRFAEEWTNDMGMVVIDVSDPRLVKVSGFIDPNTEVQTVSLRSIDATFPDYRKFIANDEDAQHFNGAYLKKLIDAAGLSAVEYSVPFAVRLQEAGKPMVVNRRKYGEADYYGVLMSVRQ
jgi:DNA polymerase III sliding clamp (beta) subunit (PCNA family)